MPDMAGNFSNFFKLFWQRLTKPVRDEFLCDSCRYDYDGACHRPERPNATVCPDYKKNN